MRPSPATAATKARQTLDVRFRVLGPLEVVDGDRAVDLGAPKQRAVLAMLLIDANRVVRVDRLIDCLWGDDAPARAMGSLQAYISNLRRVLEPDRAPRQPSERIVTRGNGYVAVVAPDDLDATSFEAAVADGHELLTRGHHQAAYDRLSEGLALWRGGALSDFMFEPFAIAEQNRLEQLRLLALEDSLRGVTRARTSRRGRAGARSARHRAAGARASVGAAADSALPIGTASRRAARRTATCAPGSSRLSASPPALAWWSSKG